MKGLLGAGSIVTTTATVILLDRFQPIERIPMIGAYANWIELGVGGLGMGVLGRSSDPVGIGKIVGKAALAGMFISGAQKTVRKLLG